MSLYAPASYLDQTVGADLIAISEIGFCFCIFHSMWSFVESKKKLQQILV
jgi:hypothetical protein